MPYFGDLEQRDPRVMMVWRRFLAESLQKQLLLCDDKLPISEVSRRARISASLRLRNWERANPYTAQAVA